LPLSEGSTETRKEELRKAHDFLDAVAKGDVRIEDAAGTIPESTEATTVSGGSTLLNF
jgi:hypothetical protein